MTLETLFQKPASLPVIPHVVQLLIGSFAQEDVSTETIASHLGTDPVLAAKTLRLANSAYFHVSRQIQTVEEALRMLGFVMVRNLVISAGLVHAFRNLKGLDLPLFWRHTACVAGGARFLASAAEENADLASMVGLTQGLGHLVMRGAALDELPSLDRACHPLSQPRAEAEVRVLGYHHGQVAAELARRWKFPELLCNTLAVLPEQACASDTPLLGAVRLAQWNARRECLSPELARQPAEPPQTAGRLQLAWQGQAPALMVLAGDLDPVPLPGAHELGGALAAALT